MARDVEINVGDFPLEHGDVLEGDCIRGRLYGPKGAPIIVVPGGISASRFVADGEDGIDGSGGWWSDMIFSGGPIDLNKFQVLGYDAAPSSSNLDARVTITTHDQARRLALLLDHVDAPHVHSLIGMSYGGMISLAFAELFPQRVRSLLIFGAAHKPYPMAVAHRGIQRRIVDMAAGFGDAQAGLKLARELAMTTYRSPAEFAQRFDAAPTRIVPHTSDVGDYLEARGKHYKSIMPVNRFLALSESIDLHRVDATKINAPTTLIAVKSDQLAPPSEMQALCDALSGSARLHVIDSIYGHDAFLKATELLAPLVADFAKGGRCAA